MALILWQKIPDIIGVFYIESEKCKISISSGPADHFAIIIGLVLILISVATLYIFKFHKRPEFIVYSGSPSVNLWQKYGYSFQRDKLINPLIIKDLIGWCSDSGRQIASIDICGSNTSNRYHGGVTERELNGKIFVEVQECDSGELFGYEYIGTSESGINVIHAYVRTNGSATFNWILLLQVEESSLLEYEDSTPIQKITPVLKVVGSLSLGDRYCGNVSMDRGVIRIGKDNSDVPDHVINSSKTIIVK